MSQDETPDETPSHACHRMNRLTKRHNLNFDFKNKEFQTTKKKRLSGKRSDSCCCMAVQTTRIRRDLYAVIQQ
jgi:hypothetical protein